MHIVIFPVLRKLKRCNLTVYCQKYIMSVNKLKLLEFLQLELLLMVLLDTVTF